MDFASLELTNAISYVSLIVSGTLAIFYIRDRRHAKFAIERDYCEQLLTWHSAVVDVLIQLNRYLPGAPGTGKHELLSRLSALIEQGRFFFPNIEPDGYGKHKPPAYRGRRNIALDFLVAAYNVHNSTHSEGTSGQGIYLQRLFTSVVFEIVRPAERLLTIRKLTDRYFVKDLSVEDLEDTQVLDAMDPMWKKRA